LLLTPSIRSVAQNQGQQMVAHATAELAYYSALGADPDFAEIVCLFVDEMPLRIRDMQGHFGCANWDELSRLAHQLKGAAGSYGFDQITPFAAGLEKAVRNGESQATVRAALDALVEACGRVRPGKP
jgi:HPt (histidine-containing phosphotransfer) domain-containing protein